MGISRAQRRTQTNKKTTIPPQNKKKLHYHSHATKNLHCSIYSSKHKWRKTKPKKTHQTPNNQGSGGSCLRFSLIHLSLAKRLKLLILKPFYYNCLHHHSEPTYCFTTVIISHPLWLEQKVNTSPSFPRTHGYIPAFVETTDLADRM